MKHFQLALLIGLTAAVMALVATLQAAALSRISQITNDLNPTSRAAAAPPGALEASARFMILSARWGGGKHWADVTAQLVRKLASGKTIWANPPTLGSDPTPGWRKRLEIIYVIHGERKTIWFNEDTKIDRAKLLANK